MSELVVAILTFMITFIFMGITFGITPYLMRRNTQFGVTLPEKANERLDIRKLKKQFAIYNIGIGVLGALVMLSALLPGLTEEQAMNFVTWGGTGMTIIFTSISFIIYISFHKKVKMLKQQYFNVNEIRADARIMVDTDFRSSEQPIVVSNKWFFLIGIIIVLVTALAPILYWDQIPNQVPMNFNFDGTVTRFVDKTPSVFAIMPVIQLLMLPLIAMSNYGLMKAKQNIKPRSPKVSIEQNRAYRYAWSKFTILIGIGTLILLACIQFAMMELFIDMQLFTIVNLVGTFALVVVTLYLTVKYGQGGERYQPKIGDKKENAYEGVDDDEYWKLGVFYFNPNDPAVFVEKRFGIGVSFNFARWQTWAFIGVLILLTILLTIIPFFLA